MSNKKFAKTNCKHDVTWIGTEAVSVAHVSPVEHSDEIEEDLSEESCRHGKKRASRLKMGIAFIDTSLSSDESDSKDTTRKKRVVERNGRTLDNVVYDGSTVETKSDNLFTIDRSGVNARAAPNEFDWNERTDITINADFVYLESRSNEGMANGIFDVVVADVPAEERLNNEGLNDRSNEEMANDAFHAVVADVAANERSNEEMANEAFHVVVADAGAHEWPVNEPWYEGVRVIGNMNLNGVVAVTNMNEFKALGSRYHKFHYSFSPGFIHLNRDATEYNIGRQVGETVQRAKFYARNDIRTIVNDYRDEKEGLIRRRYGNEEIIAMNAAIVMLTNECAAIAIKLNNFVDSLIECASLDFGFGTDSKMCYCPCSATTRVFRELFLTDEYIDGNYCKNRKALSAMSLCQHLHVIGYGTTGFSVQKAMHRLSHIFLQKKFPECFQSDSGLYGIRQTGNN